MKAILIFIPLGMLFLAGCAVPKEARDTAGVLALYTARVKADAEQFSTARLELDKARTANTDFLERSAVSLENANALQLKVWQISNNNDRAKVCQGVTEAVDLVSGQIDSFAVLRQKQADAVANMKSAVAVQSKQLDETAKGLSGLAESPSWTEEIKFYYGFFSEVRAGITNLHGSGLAQIKAGTNDVSSKNRHTNRR